MLGKIQKISVCVLTALVLSGCPGRVDMKQTPVFIEPPSLSEIGVFVPIGKTKAVMLLPLSGQYAKVGEALQNAALMAQVERVGNQMDLLFFDTQGTAEGTRQAFVEAMNENPNVILGPVFAAEVAEVSSARAGIPVISFTSDNSVLSPTVFSDALLIPDQVRRIVQSACYNNRKKLAVIGPENKAGELFMNALNATVVMCPGMEVAKLSLYNPTVKNFDPAVLKIAPKQIDPKKVELTSEEQDELAKPMLERLGFDALIVFEDGIKLQQLASLFSYYDVTPDVVTIYGLSSLSKVKGGDLVGAYFPGMSTQRVPEFERKYKNTFGEAPIDLAKFAYDAVSLASFLSVRQALNLETLTTSVGFYGVTGRLRFNPDGGNERLLGIYQMGGRGAVLVEESPVDFYDGSEFLTNPELIVSDAGDMVEDVLPTPMVQPKASVD